MDPVLVITSCGKLEDADIISKELLQAGLAACVQISSPVKSRYWWEGDIVEESEYIVTIKSEMSKFDAIETLLSKIHPYEIPELLALDIKKVSRPFLGWLQSELKKT